jgi:hypothetical protein
MNWSSFKSARRHSWPYDDSAEKSFGEYFQQHFWAWQRSNAHIKPEHGYALKVTTLNKG